MKVSRKEAMTASLKAERSLEGSSSRARSVRACFSSSWTVGRLRFSAESTFSSVEFVIVVAVEEVLGEGDGMALMLRVTSQSNGAGLAIETTYVTIRPVMMAARFPARVGYSKPVVSTVRVP